MCDRALPQSNTNNKKRTRAARGISEGTQVLDQTGPHFTDYKNKFRSLGRKKAAFI